MMAESDSYFTGEVWKLQAIKLLNDDIDEQLTIYHRTPVDKLFKLALTCLSPPPPYPVNTTHSLLTGEINSS